LKFPIHSPLFFVPLGDGIFFGTLPVPHVFVPASAYYRSRETLFQVFQLGALPGIPEFKLLTRYGRPTVLRDFNRVQFELFLRLVLLELGLSLFTSWDAYGRPFHDLRVLRVTVYIQLDLFKGIHPIFSPFEFANVSLASVFHYPFFFPTIPSKTLREYFLFQRAWRLALQVSP